MSNDDSPRRAFSGLAAAAVALSNLSDDDDEVGIRRTALAEAGTAAKKALVGASRAIVADAAAIHRSIMRLQG